MQGTVHRRLVEERQGELKTGAVLLLKQVTLLDINTSLLYKIGVGSMTKICFEKYLFLSYMISL